MSKCSTCGNEKSMCICPKGIDGGDMEESKDETKDKAYEHAVTQVANALLAKYTAIYENNPNQLSEFIDNLREVLGREYTEHLIELLEDGVVTETDKAIFIERFQNLNPNMGMLDALSHQFSLNVFPSPANQFVDGMKNALQGLEGWPPYPNVNGENFEQTLKSYAAYLQKIPPEKQPILSSLFWAQINQLGTPIVESNPDKPSECNVHFLMPKDQLEKSEKDSQVKKELYLQGDFHGYGSTRESQKLVELENTGIMWRQDSMAKDAIVVYQYVQVEPGNEGLKQNPEIAPFFTDAKELVPEMMKPAKYVKIPGKSCIDTNSTHAQHFPNSSPDRVFRVHPDPNQAHLPNSPVDWPSLLNTKTPTGTKNFVYHATLYSDEAGKLHRSDAPITKQYHNDLYFSDQTKDSPYHDFTRSVQVFKPASGKIDNVVVINDGIPYLMTGMLEKCEQMVADEKLSPNTAFVFITTMPGLKNTLSKDELTAYENDPAVQLPGMGVRMIDYQYRVDQYADFIGNQLLPELNKELDLPDSPSHRVLIGSSLSGTASMHMGVKHPEIFGAVVAQSPSSTNRTILTGITPEMVAGKNIQISCGLYECPARAAANDFLGYAVELSNKLSLPLQTASHGHQFRSWNDTLPSTLPAAMEPEKAAINLQL